jgi:hypothetical protein
MKPVDAPRIDINRECQPRSLNRHARDRIHHHYVHHGMVDPHEGERAWRFQRAQYRGRALMRYSASLTSSDDRLSSRLPRRERSERMPRERRPRRPVCLDETRRSLMLLKWYSCSCSKELRADIAQCIHRDRARRTSPNRRIESVGLTELLAEVRLVRKSTPQSNVAQ